MEPTQTNEPKRGDTYSYRGWIVSDNFFKRAIAVWAHVLVIQIIFAAVLFALFAVLGLTAFMHSMKPGVEWHSEMHVDDGSSATSTATTTDEV